MVITNESIKQVMDIDTFWNLSLPANIPVMRKGVMALLWIMRCPRGLDRTIINPERRHYDENNRRD